ncbi:hypothetical protein JW823_06335 [bacterium]|nr:hypothetical protein [candidate division CSSED10-310 bacterium]
MPSTEDCLFLHASSVVVTGGACLFLGHSTAGKSTIARRLAGIFPLLADDTVLAIPDGMGGWEIMDGKARHKDRERLVREALDESNQGKRIPLRACMRIRKTNSVQITPIDAQELARYLLDAVMEVDMQRGPKNIPDDLRGLTWQVATTRCQRLKWFQAISQIARRYPGWQLWFSKDSHLSDLITAVRKAADWNVNHVK